MIGLFTTDARKMTAVTAPTKRDACALYPPIFPEDLGPGNTGGAKKGVVICRKKVAA